jgi:hypothetical protein
LILVGVTQTLGTLSRNCEQLAAAQCRNRLKPEQFRTIGSDLFGNITLVRNQGRIGTNGRELVEVFATELEAPLGNRNHRPDRALHLDFSP